MNKKNKSKQVKRDAQQDDELEPIELLIEDFEKFNDVERSFNQILEIENEIERVKILVDFSRYLTNNGFFTEAKVFAAMIEETYDDSDAFAECARVYFGHKEFGKCIEMNKQALLRNSSRPEQIQSDMGLALMKNGNLEEAIVLLESTIKDNPSFVDAYINLALCYKEQNDYTRALSSLENALKLNSSDARIYSNIGCIYHLQEKYEDAIVNFLKAQEYDQSDAETLNNLGLALMKIGNLEYSNLTFEEALLLEPGNPEIINNYMLCLLTGKQFSKFIKMLSNIKRLITERQYEKYKALHNKFVKACGISLDGISSLMKGNLAQNKHQSESSWNPADSETNDRNKSLLSKVAKKKSLISIEEESED
jgi:Tfp pilus assembly protein PilF